MNVVHVPEKKEFQLQDEHGQKIGFLEYMRGGDGELYATHTEVNPSQSGQGYAALLLDALVEYAQEQGVKVVPLCGYVISSFKRYPEKYSSVF